MAGIQLTGLASGFDWKNTVTQLMAIERVPQDNLKRQQAAAVKLQAAFDTLKSNLTALKSAASALSTSFTGSPRSVSVTPGDSVVSASDATASTSSGAALGTYKINVKSLPKASFGIGYDAIYPKSGVAETLKLREHYGVTEGTVTVNGKQYTITSEDLDLNVSDFISKLKGVVGTFTSSFSTTSGFGQGALTLGGDGTSIALGGPGDTSNFVSALGLRYEKSPSPAYKQTIPQRVLADLAMENLGGGMVQSDSLTINGVPIGDIGPSEKLSSVVSRINSKSGTGVTATIDPSNGRLRLTANINGDYPITVTGAAASALGLDTAGPSGKKFTVTPGSGTTFELTVNGDDSQKLEYTSTTGEIDLSQYGYGSTKITPSATGVFSVKVTASGADNRTKINSLISAYNSLKQMVDESTKVTTGTDGKVSASVFSNRADINSLLSSIRTRVYSEVKGTGISTQYNTMGKIGIGFDRNGTMSVVDSSKLDAALTNFPSAVDALLNAGRSGVPLDVEPGGIDNYRFFVTNSGLVKGQQVTADWLSPGTTIKSVQGPTNGKYEVEVTKPIKGVVGSSAIYSPTLESQGIATRLVSLMNSLTGTGGLVASATTAITSQNKRLQSQIDAMDRTLAQQQAALEASFIAMERAQSKYNSMSSQIASAFTSNK